MKSLYITIVLAQFILFSCNSESTTESDAPQKFVSRSMFGNEWPLTIDKGTLKCLDYGGVVFITEDGQIYGVNGTAKTYGKTAGYSDIEDIWADDLVTKKSLMEVGVSEKDASSKISIGPLLDEGLKLCK
ncbi:MAG: DUF2511 domain-containing protein [Fluviicola sp.]